METEIANSKRYINAIQAAYPYEFKSVSNDNLKIEVTEYLSHGGFGITYLGNYHSREGNKKPFNTQKVIIKEFFMDMSNNGKCVRASNGENVVFADKTDTIQYFQKKFEKESDILSKLSHPNIVNVLHDFKANNTSYFVMEHIEGVTLMEYIKKNGPFKSFDATWKYMGPLCEGLKEVHEKGIIHCDISPNNIMVETESNGKVIKRLVLIDFGGCRSYNVSEKEGADLSRVSLMTYTNSYSPLELTNLKFYNETYEDAQIKEIKASTDIYSIGATLYYMMIGNHPQDCYELTKKELRFPEGFNPKVAPVIMAAMQPKRENRPQTMDTFISKCVESLETEEEKLKQKIKNLENEIINKDSEIKGLRDLAYTYPYFRYSYTYKERYEEKERLLGDYKIKVHWSFMVICVIFLAMSTLLIWPHLPKLDFAFFVFVSWLTFSVLSGLCYWWLSDNHGYWDIWYLKHHLEKKLLRWLYIVFLFVIFLWTSALLSMLFGVIMDHNTRAMLNGNL